MGVFDIFKKKKPDFDVQDEPLRRLGPDEVNSDIGRSRFDEDFGPKPFIAKDMGNEVVNAKLDRVIDKLELMDKRLQDIEKIAKEE